MTTGPNISPDDLRAAIARSGLFAYVVAARARVNPIRLSALLHGRARLTQAMAARILRAIEEERGC